MHDVFMFLFGFGSMITPLVAFLIMIAHHQKKQPNLCTIEESEQKNPSC